MADISSGFLKKFKFKKILKFQRTIKRNRKRSVFIIMTAGLSNGIGRFV